jgi:hypothetical protein
MAKRKKWTGEAEPEVAAAETTASLGPMVISLDEAKAIVNRAVQPGYENDRPPLELLDAAKAIVNAAVQPKAPV